MQTPVIKIIRVAVIIFAVFTIAGYSYFQTRELIKGPRISISEPLSGSVVHSPLVGVEGIAKNISHIALNDRDIFVDEEGNFKEKLLVSYGYNIIEVQVKDRFGRESVKTIEVVYR